MALTTTYSQYQQNQKNVGKLTNLLDSLSRIIAEILSPFVLVGVLLASVALRFDDRPALTAGGVILFLVLIPQALALWMAHTKQTTDKFIVQREQRHRFYALSAGSFLAGIAFTWIIQASWQVRFSSAFALGILAVVAVINLRLKISVHALAASFTALCAPVVLGAPVVSLALVPVALCVPWARVHQRRHSAIEAGSGFLLGLLSGALFWALLMR